MRCPIQPAYRVAPDPGECALCQIPSAHRGSRAITRQVHNYRQRTHDLDRPPGPVLSGHLADQRPRVFRDAGPARRSPAPSGPGAPPRGAMPAHHRRGLHDQDVGPPGTPALGDGRPETAIRDGQPWTTIRPLMDQQLLPQDEVLQDQVLTGSAGQPQRQEEQSEIQPHQTTLQRRRVAHVGGSDKNRSRSGFGPSHPVARGGTARGGPPPDARGGGDPGSRRSDQSSG